MAEAVAAHPCAANTPDPPGAESSDAAPRAAYATSRSRLPASFSCWRSLVISTTFHASPSRFIARITQPPGSTSHHFRP